MMRLVREFRLIPIVLVATASLFALKIFGLLLDGGYLLGSRTLRNDNPTITLNSDTRMLTPQTVTLDGMPSSASERPSWMREIFGYPDVTGSVNSGRPGTKIPAGNPANVTGSSAAPKPPPTEASKEAPPADKGAPASAGKNPPEPPKAPAVAGTQVPLDNMRSMSAAERAILERLSERRQELDKRARELDMRESMLKDAEAKLDLRMGEIKEMEAKSGGGAKKKEEAEKAGFKNLATMYENMKAKDAAKIFDRLDIKILLDMTSQINPRRMSEILAQMSPDSAERLTTELASRASGGDKAANPNNLPKIEGRPNGS